MLLLIDNFDSFTYNLVQYFQVIGDQVKVIRNNLLTIQECLNLNPVRLVISPGPGNPSQAGISKDLLLACAGKLPILGVCLGHQCLAEIYGGRVIRAHKPMHGKTSPIFHDGQGVFQGLPQGLLATRYHSLIVERASLPNCLKITAETSDGEIMGLRHRTHQHLESVQFHPESIMTEHGMDLLKNFSKLSFKELLC